MLHDRAITGKVTVTPLKASKGGGEMQPDGTQKRDKFKAERISMLKGEGTGLQFAKYEAEVSPPRIRTTNSDPTERLTETFRGSYKARNTSIGINMFRFPSLMLNWLVSFLAAG